MREEQLDALLKEFRSIADEQMADLTMTPERKERILQACLSPQEDQNAGVLPLRKKKPRPGMRWGTAAAAAAVLLVAVLGGAKLFLTGAGSAGYNESVSCEASPQEAPESVENMADTTGEEAEKMVEEEVAAEEPMMVPGALPTMSPVGDSGQSFAEAEKEQGECQEEPAGTAGNSAPVQGQSGSGKAPERPAEGKGPEGGETLPEKEEDEAVWEDEDALLEEEDDLEAEDTLEEAEEVEEEAADSEQDGDSGFANTVPPGEEEILEEEPVEEEPPQNDESAEDPAYGGVEVYLSARVVSCDTVALSWVDGQTVVAYDSVTAQAAAERELSRQTVQPAAEKEEEEISEEEIIEEAPAWHSALGYGYVEGENVILHVTTLTVDRIHWGPYLSPGILVKVITREEMTSGAAVTVLLGGTRPELCPASGVMLRFDTVAPYYAVAFTGSSASEIEAVVKALG